MKLKFFLTVLLFKASVLSLTAQILQPVHWSYSLGRVSAGAQELVFTARMDKTWHIYSPSIADGGPIPVSLSFEKSGSYELAGKITEEGKVISEYSKEFEMDLKYYEEKVVFRQKIKITDSSPFEIKGTLTYAACNDKGCLPPEDVAFEFNMSGDPKTVEPARVKQEDTGRSSQVLIKADTLIHADTLSPAVILPAPDNTLEPGCGEGQDDAVALSSPWGIFAGGVLGGLLALLTPCVFPMIPLTVSFFTKQSRSRKKGIRNALIYAVSIIVIYVGLGLLISVSLGSDALNDMASSGFFNMLFFVIFILFAISFFGVFEITLPGNFVNKADKASEQGGLPGIFFMAFTLSLVSFSCTGPIIGTLLVEAAHGGNYLGPLMGMGGFALALALPFALFAAFPGWLHSLPKSGGWLNSVKVTLGFIELALALKFLSNVDLAYHWGLLKREIFIAIWVIIFGMLGVYLLGKIRFRHDSKVKQPSITRILMAILVFAFTAYLIPGIWGAPLNLISGFPPPEFYREWTSNKATHCPHNLNCYHDYESGMAYAREQQKPVMIDFTGWSCVNCRKMEDNVWSDPSVLKRISEDYVLISLYVDDKEPLPAGEQKISLFSGKKIKTAGNRWSDMQASVYGSNSQPYYVLLDCNGRMLARPRGYTPDAAQYLNFLDEGLCRLRKRQAAK